MTITPQDHSPGITLIYGDQVGRSRCQQDDADEFRVCIGEIRDDFTALPKGRDIPVDVALVAIGPQGAGGIADTASQLAHAHRDAGVDVRAALYPHPYQVPGAPREASEWPRFYGPNEWKQNGRDIVRAANLVRKLVAYPSGLSYLNAAVRSGYLAREPYRADARLLVLVIAAGEDRWGGVAELARQLDESKGSGRWSAEILCLRSDCQTYAPLVEQGGGRIVSVAHKDLEAAVFDAVKGAARDLNRWTLSRSPTTSGYMEVRVDDRTLPPTQYTYDPFERRVRVADSVLDGSSSNGVQVWYFPFHPSQVLAEVCPAAVERQATGTVQVPQADAESSSGALPCKGWMADELQRPIPAPIIDVVFEGLPEGTARRPNYSAGMAALKGPFQAHGVDLSVQPRATQWRRNAFHVLVVPRGFRSESAEGADAVLEWEGRWDESQLETLGWRIISRTIRVPITGMPIRFDTLRVFLNGRPIEPTTRDGAGYVLKGGSLFLDVAAPLHADSHLFAVYRHDVRGRRK